MYLKFFKPLLDFTVAFTGLMILSPIFILVGVLLAVANKGNPLFLQVRPGKDECLFRIIKFKTMSDERDKDGNLLPDDKRLTSIGRFIRKTSLDEIPQLINVLKGDMSLVGPRPLLPEYLELYTARQKKRHEVKPGITGWTQINGRNELDWEDKFEHDVWYVQHVSFLVDLEIILKTFKKVVMREGVNAEGHPTMPRFSEYLKQKSNL